MRACGLFITDALHGGKDRDYLDGGRGCDDSHAGPAHGNVRRGPQDLFGPLTPALPLRSLFA